MPNFHHADREVRPYNTSGVEVRIVRVHQWGGTIPSTGEAVPPELTVSLAAGGIVIVPLEIDLAKKK